MRFLAVFLILMPALSFAAYKSVSTTSQLRYQQDPYARNRINQAGDFSPLSDPRYQGGYAGYDPRYSPGGLSAMYPTNYQSPWGGPYAATPSTGKVVVDLLEIFTGGFKPGSESFGTRFWNYLRDDMLPSFGKKYGYIAAQQLLGGTGFGRILGLGSRAGATYQPGTGFQYDPRRICLSTSGSPFDRNPYGEVGNALRRTQ